MPSVPRLRGYTPVSVRHATEVLGSELRVRLIRHFVEQPGSQVDAVRALGVTHSTVARNISTLVERRVLVEAPDPSDGRAHVYHVNLERYDELVDALRAYAHAGADAPRSD